MLLYIMLYIVLAYLMLFAALTNAVCLYNASFLPLISANAFYFHALSLFIEEEEEEENFISITCYMFISIHL